MHPGRQLPIGRHVAAVGSAGQEPRAHDEIAAAVGDRIQQTRDLLGAVLVVAGDDDDDIEALAAGHVEPLANGVADALDGAERQHVRAPGAGDLDGTVRRSVVDHQDLVDDVPRRPSDDLADLRLLVVGGRDQQNLEALVHRRGALRSLRSSAGER